MSETFFCYYVQRCFSSCPICLEISPLPVCYSYKTLAKLDKEHLELLCSQYQVLAIVSFLCCHTVLLLCFGGNLSENKIWCSPSSTQSFCKEIIRSIKYLLIYHISPFPLLLLSNMTSILGRSVSCLLSHPYNAFAKYWSYCLNEIKGENIFAITTWFCLNFGAICLKM